ncbi:DUF1344 domain-containing protein [Phenylobacterium sp.]|jgi:Cu/Ag efflux protein CusF|uniref:DUF1344 domain-containing protein n=1 Tax=Phenylobacterium sp. TaxID=1871053 RepID=UPI002F3EE2CC
MKTSIVAALAATLILSAGSAWAWEDVTGKITSVDEKTHALVLDNGQTYSVDKSVKLSAFKTGDTVTVSTEMKGGKTVVNKVTKSS